MKPNRILFISIPIGILLSGCSTKQIPPSSPSEIGINNQSSNGKNTRGEVIISQQTKALPNYVKHNPRTVTQSQVKTTDATITVQLICLSDGSGAYINYWTTDNGGRDGLPPHSKNNKKNESFDSPLFNTTFPCDAKLIVKEDNREVTIEVETTGKHYKWRSDATYHQEADQTDGDVRWICKKCP
jgi:hypothetical protein